MLPLSILRRYPFGMSPYKGGLGPRVRIAFIVRCKSTSVGLRSATLLLFLLVASASYIMPPQSSGQEQQEGAEARSLYAHCPCDVSGKAILNTTRPEKPPEEWTWGNLTKGLSFQLTPAPARAIPPDFIAIGGGKLSYRVVLKPGSSVVPEVEGTLSSQLVERDTLSTTPDRLIIDTNVTRSLTFLDGSTKSILLEIPFFLPGGSGWPLPPFLHRSLAWNATFTPGPGHPSNFTVLMLIGAAWNDGTTLVSSRVQIPFLNAQSVRDLSTFDVLGNKRTLFFVNPNWTQGGSWSRVFVRVNITDPFGGRDIANVSLRITDPLGIAERFLMQVLPPRSGETLFRNEYFYEWSYDATATLGLYQAVAEAFDAEENRFSSTPVRFELRIFTSPPPPLEIPWWYFLVVVPVAGGSSGYVLLRRRKRRLYLAGFDHFEILSGGALPKSALVMVLGNTGSGKTILCEELAYNELRRGRFCIFVTTGEFPSKIRENMKNLGKDTQGYESQGLLRFIDCYSGDAGQISTEKYSVKSSSDLTTLGVRVSEALPESVSEVSVVLDSLTPLLSRVSSDVLVSFIHSVGGRVRGIGGSLYFAIGTSADRSLVSKLEEISDGSIEMEVYEEEGLRKSRMRIRKLRTRSFSGAWIPFSVEPGRGMIFYTRRRVP